MSVDPGVTLPSTPRPGSISHTALAHNNTSLGISQPTGFTSIGSKLSQSSPTVAHTAAFDVESAATFNWVVSGSAGKVVIGFEIYDYVAPAGGTTLSWWDESTIEEATSLDWWSGSTLTDVTSLDWFEPA